MIKKTVNAGILLAVTLSALGFACDAKPVKIRFAHWDSNAALIDTVKEFNRTHPDIFVSYEAVSYDKVPVMFAAGSAPDLLSEGPWVGFGRLAARGMFKDLSAYFKSTYKMSQFMPEIIEGSSVKGAIYGMPTGMANSGFIAYNKQLFDKNGVSYPTKDWTTVDLLVAAKKMTLDTNGDGKLDVWGFGSGETGPFVDLIRSAGGSMYNRNMTKLAFDTPEAIKAMTWWSELVTKYNIRPGNGGPDEWGKGKAAMVQSHPQGLVLWTSNTKNKLDAGTMFWPKDADTGLRRFAIDFNLISMAGSTKHPKEAWEFLKWFNTPGASPASFRKVMGTLQLVPPLKAIARSDAYLKPDRAKLPASFDMSVFADGVEGYSVAREDSRYQTDIDNVLNGSWPNVLLKKISVQQYVDRVTKEVNQILTRK